MNAASRNRKVLAALLLLALLGGCDRTKRSPDMPPKPPGMPEPRTVLPHPPSRVDVPAAGWPVLRAQG